MLRWERVNRTVLRLLRHSLHGHPPDRDAVKESPDGIRTHETLVAEDALQGGRMAFSLLICPVAYVVRAKTLIPTVCRPYSEVRRMEVLDLGVS